MIELLAVIIILAIVALIATPIILNVIDDARKSAAKSETSMVLSGIQSYCATEDMKVQMNTLEGARKCNATITKADVATMVSLGNAKVTDVTVSDGKYSFSVLSNGYKYVVSNSVIPESGTKTTALE